MHGREDDGDLYLEQTKPNELNRYTRYALDSLGNPTRVIAEEDYAFREQEWYAKAVTKGKPTWSSVYQWSDRPDILSISSSFPVYDKANRLVCVLGIDFILSQISAFLKALNISKSGRVFIIERNGLIVASSSSEKPYLQVNGQAQRLLQVLQSLSKCLNITDNVKQRTFYQLMWVWASTLDI